MVVGFARCATSRPPRVTVLQRSCNAPLQVLDKSRDAFVLFYKPNATFCEGNGTSYTAFGAAVRGLGASGWANVHVLAMDVATNKSPFVFEDAELPVVMLFPSVDKR